MAYPISTQPQVMAYTTTSSEWHSDVMDCCEDMGICLCGAFVPCILACRVSTDYGECCCVPYAAPGALLAMRTGIRERYRIPLLACSVLRNLLWFLILGLLLFLPTAYFRPKPEWPTAYLNGLCSQPKDAETWLPDDYIGERARKQGSICNDCVCLTFCGVCTLCQMARELKARQ